MLSDRPQPVTNRGAALGGYIRRANAKALSISFLASESSNPSDTEAVGFAPSTLELIPETVVRSSRQDSTKSGGTLLRARVPSGASRRGGRLRPAGPYAQSTVKRRPSHGA